MKFYCSLIFILSSFLIFSQDNSEEYKKRVLENTEVEFLASYYSQEGDNAAVTGGIGTEELTDVTPTIVISMPLNADDVLTVDAGISAYTSASSSNLDPFDTSGASSGEGEDDDDDDEGIGRYIATGPVGSPWVASTGASSSDVWGNVTIDYSHSSEDRNTLWSAHGSVSAEYDYFSIGLGGSLSKLFFDKNTEISLKTQVYLDQWNPRYPTELDSYVEVNGQLNQGFFTGVTIWTENGTPTHPVGNDRWSPVEGFSLIDKKGRNSYSASINFSQILNKNAQVSLFIDAVLQDGWLANPMQRVYFNDRPNYYIGNPDSIDNYTSSSNIDVFQLADDIERLPNTRFKTPFGMRFNYYINEYLSLRTYYRYYVDNWGMTSHTANVEIPIKVGDRFTLFPSYRYYTQTAIDYFAPYEEHLSTQSYYTSDFDLSAFDAHQYGLGIRYTDIFTKLHVWKLGLKNLDLRYKYYNRSTGLKAGIISFGAKLIMD